MTRLQRTSTGVKVQRRMMRRSESPTPATAATARPSRFVCTHVRQALQQVAVSGACSPYFSCCLAQLDGRKLLHDSSVRRARATQQYLLDASSQRSGAARLSTTNASARTACSRPSFRRTSSPMHSVVLVVECSARVRCDSISASTRAPRPSAAADFEICACRTCSSSLTSFSLNSLRAPSLYLAKSISVAAGIAAGRA